MLRDHGFKPYSGPNSGSREDYGASAIAGLPGSGRLGELEEDVAEGNLGSRSTGNPVLDAQILEELQKQVDILEAYPTIVDFLPSGGGGPRTGRGPHKPPGVRPAAPSLPTVKQPKPSLPATPPTIDSPQTPRPGDTVTPTPRQDTPKPPTTARFPSRGDVEKDLSKGAVRENNDGSRSVIWGKHDGDAEAARRDFERFAEGHTVNEYPNGTKSFRLPDGSNVTLRGSSDSRPTISIEKRGEPTQKFRYGQPEGKP